MKLFKEKGFFLLLLFILAIGFIIRRHDLYTWPREGATFDEYAWTWQGISLIQNHVPTSWSYHPQYKNRKEIKYRKAFFILVTPYLEHPPFFGLIAGSFALLNGVRDMYHVDLYHIRGLALFLGLASILLVYLLVNQTYDKKTALVSALLFATIPTIAIGSRIVQNENFFIPIWLLILYLTSKYLERKKNYLLIIIGVLCGLIMLAKVPWVAAPFSVLIILFFSKKYKDIFCFLGIVVAIFLLYFIYGFYYDSKLFLSLWSLQLNRYDISFASIYALFLKPYLVDRFYLDGWIYVGWISFMVLLIKDLKKNLFLVSAVISYFLVFLIAIPDEAGHGWYRYPFYPFLIISIALFLKEYFAKNWILTFFFLVFIGAALFGLTWYGVFGFSYLIFRVIIISWGFVLIPIYFRNKKLEKTAIAVSYIWLTIFILMNIWAIAIYNEM